MEFYDYYIVLILLWAAVLFFNFREIKRVKDSKEKDTKYLYCTQVAIFIGVLIRSIDLSIPTGMFPDEAMGGYNSWCLAHYGVDMHLDQYPVYLKAWGSGMNALYAYLAIPFIKLFGLSLPVFRLPMTLIGCVSLVMLFYTLRKTQKSNSLIFFIILFIVISPWHIMKSRWALESNLAPDLLLIGTCFLILAYNALTKQKQTLYFLIGFAFIGLTAYSYAATWFMLPFYCVTLFFFFYKKGKISVPQIALYMVTLAIITIPLILFAVLIVTGGDALHLGPITIPTLTFGRHQDTTLLGSGDFLNKASIYAGKAFHLLFFGDDTFRWNTFYLFGQFYNIIAIPFIIIAAIYLKKDKEERNIFDRLFLLWLITSLPVLILVEANVNHWNVLWFPLIYFAARGIYFCTRKRMWLRYVSVGIALLLFLAFGRKYVSFFSKPDTAYISGFWHGYKEYLDFAKTKNFERIYFSEIYPFTLFNDPVNPYEYNEIKIERADDGYDFERVSGYGNYSFYIPKNIEPLPNTAYLIRNDKFDFSKIEQEKFHIERGITYTLLWNE